MEQASTKESASEQATRLAKTFNLSDAIVLVAATAGGFALSRELPRMWVSFLPDAIERFAIPMIMTWSFAILGLNLTRYRTTFRELASRPGFSATFAIVIERAAGLLHAVDNQKYYITWGKDESLAETLDSILVQDLASVVRDSGALALLMVWVVTAMAGCWRPEKSWIDRTGRTLGVVLVLTVSVYWVSNRIFPPTMMPPCGTGLINIPPPPPIVPPAP